MHGKVGLKGVPGQEISFFDISKFTHWAVGGPIVGSNTFVYDNPTIDPKRATVSGTPFSNIGAYAFNAMVVEIEIDERTGHSKIIQAWSATDVGRAINPQLVEGQLEGGFVQGLGYTLFEEMIWDNGRLANPNLMDYKVPGSMDVPYDIHTIIVENPEPDGPYGAKGVGEIGIVTVPGSIANAIKNASNIEMRKLPITAERVFNALRSKEENNET